MFATYFDVVLSNIVASELQMLKPIVGLHHVTAIASNPQRTLDFYTDLLGQRFVKKTVNFDDPGTYHLYFGDDLGRPGTILTFFPWQGIGRGQSGAGETVATAFSAPSASIGFWKDRLSARGVAVTSERRFDADVLKFVDPDGMPLEIVAHDHSYDARPSRFSEIPAEHAIRGFFGVTLLERNLAETSAVLELLGFQKISESGARNRFTAAGDEIGTMVDVVVDPVAPRGHLGAGSVHHIAFRAPDDTAQLAWRSEIAKHMAVSPVMDRDYFHSIYFREPGGVLFELATDPPGFTRDESLEHLGEELKIPAWLEPKRKAIEHRLATLQLQKEVSA
jgi:glyoxalase family protein